MSKFKIGDEVEVTTRLEKLEVGQIVEVAGFYRALSGGDEDGLVLRDRKGKGMLHLIHRDYVKPVPPKPQVPAELWVRASSNGCFVVSDQSETARCNNMKFWRYVLAEGQE